jgi:hypothetical protein
MSADPMTNAKKLRALEKQLHDLRRQRDRLLQERDELRSRLRRKRGDEMVLRALLKRHRRATVPVLVAAKVSALPALFLLPAGNALWLLSLSVTVAMWVTAAYLVRPYARHWWKDSLRPAIRRLLRRVDPVPVDDSAELPPPDSSLLQLHTLPRRRSTADS